jgi:hypothetical protein
MSALTYTRKPISAMIGIGLAGLLAAVAMAFPASGDAGVGITAAYRAGTGYCWDNGFVGTGNQILATSPVMDAAQITTTGVGGSQLVGFRVILERWSETGRRWVAIDYSRIKVHRQGPWGFYSEVWYDLSGAQVDGLSRFHITTTGHYRVRYDLFWFADNGAMTGYVSALSDGLHDYRPDPPVRADWCLY